MHDGMHAHMHACVCVCVCVCVHACTCVATPCHTATQTPRPRHTCFLVFGMPSGPAWSPILYRHYIRHAHWTWMDGMDEWTMDRHQQSIYAARFCLSMYLNTHLVWALLAPKLGLRIKVVRVEHLPPAALGHLLLDFPGVFHAVKSCTSTT